MGCDRFDMKKNPRNRWLAWGGICALLLVPAVGLASDPERSYEVLFSTGFEADEGYEVGNRLAGVNEWVAAGSGGHGIVEEFFEGYGQQGFLGFNPPAPKDEFLNVWHPIGMETVDPEHPVVRFYVLMQIVDSTNGEYDDFRWSVYNTDEERLFTVDFDNSTLGISYVLDDAVGFVSTGLTYDTEGFYDLVVTMDFERNLWRASINDVPLVRDQPITTTGARLTLGDINAVWAIRKPGASGDNFLLFDNYEVIAWSRGPDQPVLEMLGVEDGIPLLRISGEEGVGYLVETSTDLTHWEALAEVVMPFGGVGDYEDLESTASVHRFYRVRQAP